MAVPGVAHKVQPSVEGARGVKSRPDTMWTTLPPTPKLPDAMTQARVTLNGTGIFYARLGEGEPAILLHGGMASSDYWGLQVDHLAKTHDVIVMDTRGHGRSPLTTRAFGYATFARDVVALMDVLKIHKASIVGWSDGAITGLQLAMTNSDRVARLFAFGANSTPDGLKPNGAQTGAFAAFTQRARGEYAALSPHPERWPQLLATLRAMWRSEPNFARSKLAATSVPTTISDGQYDEIIKPDHTRGMAQVIPGARLVVLPAVSHFGMLQNPAQFNAALDAFLADTG